MELHEWESEKDPDWITPRLYLFHRRVESYVADILEVHDSHLRHHPNVVNNMQD